MLRRLKAFASGHVHIRDVDQGDAGLQGLSDALGEDFGGDAGVGEVAVEEAGGAGYLVEGERATLAGEFVDPFEYFETQGDQLLQPPTDLVHGEAHGLIEAGDLGHLDEAPGALAQTSDGVLVEVSPCGDARERHPALFALVAGEVSQLSLSSKGASTDF